MLSHLIKNIAPKLFLLQTKAVENTEKEAMQESAQDLARADDDGFAIAKRIQRDSVINPSR